MESPLSPTLINGPPQVCDTLAKRTIPDREKKTLLTSRITGQQSPRKKAGDQSAGANLVP
jgi:hypothetical protein